MRATSRSFWLGVLLAIASTGAVAGADSSCLKHLGGTSYDIACFDTLTKDVISDTRETYEVIRKTIPPGNENGKLLDDYMKAQDDAEQFCGLEKQASTQWTPSPTPGHYNAWDSAYAECVYDQRMLQNRRLHEILKEYRSG